LGLKSQARILPMLSREELVRLYHQADITFFPSKYRSGFSRIPLEAMACGSILISYGNEGSDEIIRDGENGFLAREGDAEASAEILLRLLREPNLSAQISSNAREQIEKQFSMQTYLSNIEVFLRSTVENPRPGLTAHSVPRETK